MASKPKTKGEQKPAIDAAATSDVTGQKVASDTTFKSGAEWTGNRAGRPRGSRNKLSEDFIADFHEAWKTHGKSAIADMAVNDTTKFVQCAASLMPKEFTIKEPGLDEMSDSEVAEALNAIRSLATSHIASTLGEGTRVQSGKTKPH